MKRSLLTTSLASLLAGSLLLACDKGEGKPAGDGASRPEAAAAAASPVKGDFIAEPCQVLTEDIAGILSGGPFNPPQSNPNPATKVSGCNYVPQNPGPGSRGAFARFEKMPSKEAFLSRYCNPAESTPLDGVGQAACAMKSPDPGQVSVLALTEGGWYVQVGNSTQDKCLAALALLGAKLK